MKPLVYIFILLSSLSAAADENGPGLAPENPRFQIGDNPNWAARDFDDSGWAEPRIPGSWQSQGLGATGQTGWYRMEFRVPADWEMGELGIAPGIVGNLYEVYWNGERIGAKGSFEPYIDLPRTSAYRVFPISEPILIDQPNVVAIRVRCYWSEGGIIDEVPRIAPLKDLLAHEAELEEWQAIGLICTLVVLGLITAVAIGVAIWQRREPIAWAYLIAIASQLIWESARATVLMTGDDWLEMWSQLLLGSIYFSAGSIATLILAILVFERRTPRWIWIYSVTSVAIHLGCVVAASFWPNLETAASLLGLAWLLSYLAILAAIAIRVLRAKRRFAILFAVLVGVTAIYSFVDTMSFITPVVPYPTAWVDLTSWFMILTSIGFGTIVVARLVEHKARAEHLASQILTAEIQERSRLARELHDGVAQTLLAVKMGVETQHNAGELDVQQLLGQLDSASDELRDAAHDLHPAVLGSRSLEDAFRVHARSLGPEHVEFQIESTGEPESFAETRHHLFRVFQELLGNAVKHGGDSKIGVLWRREGGSYILQVTNQFSPTTLAEAPSEGLGSRSLRERVEILGGRLSQTVTNGEFVAKVEIPANRWA